MNSATHGIFNSIVLAGVYAPKGMGRFDDVLSPADAEALHAYLIDQAWQLKAEVARTPSATAPRAPAQPPAVPPAR
jgi:quinohemoprotein ethanol dehydrogenase